MSWVVSYVERKGTVKGLEMGSFSVFSDYFFEDYETAF
jgi:hypothetical protein